MKLDKHDKKLIKITKKSYKNIAKDFSVSRSYVWSDLQKFFNYIKDNDKVLDLGCGNGRLLDSLEKKNINYVGVDNNYNLLRQARRKFPEYYFEVQDMLDLNFIERSFDAVLCVAVLNHLPSSQIQLQVLKNLKKFMKPDAYLLMSNWNLYNVKNKKNIENFTADKNNLTDKEFYKKYKVKKELLTPKDVLTVWDKQNVLYYYAFEKHELEELLKQAGFEVIESYYSAQGHEHSKEEAKNIINIAKNVVKD